MDALVRLSCKLTHDFNNILGAIEGYATLAMNGIDKDNPATSDLREVRASVAKAAALGKQLLVFSGKQMLRKTTCGVNELIENTLKRMEIVPEANSKVETRLAPGLPAIMADAAQLEVALANLLVNAREAMPGGGAIAVSSSVVRLEGEAVNSANPQEAGPLFVKISVKDAGSGISPEVVVRLFEPLFSTTKKGVGSGLGLSTVYGVVNQHNGWVSVATEPGRGSEFSLFLPAINPSI